MIESVVLALTCEHGNTRKVTVEVYKSSDGMGKGRKEKKVVLSLTSQNVVMKKCGCKIRTGTFSHMEVFPCN
jgi:hypothetical protein